MFLCLAAQAQIQTLECFVSGKFNVLVATSVAEEGLDLPACQLVVRKQLQPTFALHMWRAQLIQGYSLACGRAYLRQV